MKLQHLSVIFIIIMIPIILVFSYYSKLQRTSLEIRIEYDKKLTTAVKEAISAYEINTTEFNYYDEREDEDNTGEEVNQREAIYASINAFTTSIANSLGMPGASQETILNYIPAMVFNMYDGFYIYGPMYIPEIAIDEDNGMAFGIEQIEGTDDARSNIWYVDKNDNTNKTQDINEAVKTCEYILNPITPYSAKYVTEDGTTNIIVEYTLDNYIKIKGVIDGTYYEKEGYLTYFGDEEETGSSSVVSTVTSNLIGAGKIEYLGKTVEPEILEENICYIDESGNTVTKEHKYVYDQEQKKCYYDESGGYFFYVDTDNNKKEVEAGTYKVIQIYNGNKAIEYFMSLTNENLPQIGEIWYDRYSDTFYDLGDSEGNGYMDGIPDAGGTQDGYWDSYSPDGTLDTPMTKEQMEAQVVGEGNTGVWLDFSAINYYINAKEFSDWVDTNLADKEFKWVELVYDSTSASFKYEEKEIGKIFKVKRSNNPENAESLMIKHKSEVITSSINLAINQVMSNYNHYNSAAKREIPKISYDDMSHVMNNISIFAFLTDLPMGYKTYNDYSFAVSSSNNDFINNKTFRYTDTSDTITDVYNHYIFCDKSTATKLTAYREHEFSEKDKVISGIHNYYNLHEFSSKLECYYCIVNRGMITIDEESDKYLQAYLEAIGREKYRQSVHPQPHGTMPQGVFRVPEETETSTGGEVSGGSDYSEVPETGGGDIFSGFNI